MTEEGGGAKGAIGSLAGVVVATAIGLGVGWAGAQGGATALGVPVMLACVAIAFAVQWLAFIPAFLLRTERFYDLTGTLTYLTLTGVAIAGSGPVDARSAVLAALVAVWSLRLGVFLFRRIHQDGKDGRFDEIKQNAPRFLVAWTLQGLWVSLTAGAALAAITSGDSPALGWLDAVGGALWLGGFAIEATADAQKRAFKRDDSNRGRFIRSGLWAWSRHPNYFGEIVLWMGVAVLAFSALSGWGYVTLVSPVFVTLLLTQVSGIPLLEERADERWGGEPAYEAYKERTPVLIPRPPRG